jgi:hypothetical protein
MGNKTMWLYVIFSLYFKWKNNHLNFFLFDFEMLFLFVQASSYPKEGKPLSSYLSYIIPSINFDGSNTSKHQHGHKATQSSSSGYNYEHFEYQDVPPDTYVDCDPTYNSMDLTKDETINEDQTSKRSSSSSEVFEEANEQQTPKISKKSPQLNLSDNSTFISPELYEFFESCLPNIVKGRQWVLLYR